MPRLTNQRYVEIHYQLRRYWLKDPAPYLSLTPNEQWNLHAFFKPNKTMTDVELVTHRRTISQQSPALPQRAGRALRKFEGAIEAIGRWRAQSSSTANHKRPSMNNPIKVWPLVQPEIDAKKIARALIALAKREVRSSNFK